jgi:hypothetical protein
MVISNIYTEDRIELNIISQKIEDIIELIEI